MRDRLIEILNEYENYYDRIDCLVCDKDEDNCSRCWTNSLSEFFISKGVFVQPCKVGEDVWCIVEGIKEVMSGKVRRFTVGEDYINVYVGIDGYFEQAYNAKEFGVKVFRCKEEAEKALKERDVR